MWRQGWNQGEYGLNKPKLNIFKNWELKEDEVGYIKIKLLHMSQS